MERETKTITTPAGKELVLKSYLTARERNAYLEVLEANGVKAAEAGKDPTSGSVVGVIRTAKSLFDAVIVSYDGSTENITSRLEDARSDEYDFVLKEASQVVVGNLAEAK